MLILEGHTGLNSTHAKSYRLNLYGANRSTFLLPITSTITPSYVRLPILTGIITVYKLEPNEAAKQRG
jgi:hypothetical protein